jgi:hypothetical protein
VSQRVIVSILLVLLLVAGGTFVARSAYQAGLARGLAEGGQVAAPGQGVPPGQGQPGPRPYPYYGPYYGHGPWGFGFGFFGFLFPLLFIFLIFALLRGLFWGGWRGGPPGAYGGWGRGVPPMFEEWHRRAHESKGESSSGVTA